MIPLLSPAIFSRPQERHRADSEEPEPQRSRGRNVQYGTQAELLASPPVDPLARAQVLTRLGPTPLQVVWGWRTSKDNKTTTTTKKTPKR